MRGVSQIQTSITPSSRIRCERQRRTVCVRLSRANSCCSDLLSTDSVRWHAGKRKAITGEEGYDCGDRGWLSQEEIKQISSLLWGKQADDAILFHQFASIATQTMIRPEELLQLRRRNTWLSESSDYAAKSGPIKLIEILSKGANKNSRTSRLLSWVVRNRELDHMCPWFWMAAGLVHDYQRMLPGKEGGHYGSMVQVFKDRPRGVLPCTWPS